MTRFVELEVLENEPTKEQTKNSKLRILVNINNICYISETSDGYATVGINSSKNVLPVVTLTKYDNIIMMLNKASIK